MGEKRRQGKAQEERSEGGWGGWFRGSLKNHEARNSRHEKYPLRLEYAIVGDRFVNGNRIDLFLIGRVFARSRFLNFQTFFRTFAHARFTLFNPGRNPQFPGKTWIFNGCRKVNKTIDAEMWKFEKSRTRAEEKFRSLLSMNVSSRLKKSWINTITIFRKTRAGKWNRKAFRRENFSTKFYPCKWF